jgi:hypothetical protein
MTLKGDFILPISLYVGGLGNVRGLRNSRSGCESHALAWPATNVSCSRRDIILLPPCSGLI